MNYLAHAYLSYGNPEILTGNMISDYIKGKKQYDYPANIHAGIKLHRQIDTFTDNHEATRQMKSFFKIPYRLYAGAFADVAYDHFLALDTSVFADETALKKFTTVTYSLLDKFTDQFPLPFMQMYPHMKTHDWLFNYRYKWGMERSFAGLVQRSAYLSDSTQAFEIFNKNFQELHQCYNAFFPDVNKFATHQFDTLLKH